MFDEPHFKDRIAGLTPAVLLTLAALIAFASGPSEDREPDGAAVAVPAEASVRQANGPG